MLRSLTITIALAMALPGASLAALPAAPANLSGQDQTFLGTAFRTDDNEVALTQIDSALKTLKS